MRKRSNAVHAQSFDEYKTVSINKITAPPKSTSSPYERPSPEEPPKENRFEAQKLSREKMKTDPNLWKEFDFCAKRNQDRNENYEDISQASTNEDGSLSSCESPLTKVPEEARIPTKVVSVMAIGAQEVEVHKVLDALFGESNGKSSCADNKKFDLVVKEIESNEQKYKLKFWVQDPNFVKHQRIIDVYYATVPFYIFMYKTSSKQSFECLSEAIERVQTKTNKAKFIGMLISSGENGEKVEVSTEEVEELCKRYGIIAGDKTEEIVGKTRQELLKMVDRQAEGKTAECIMEKNLFRQEVVCKTSLCFFS